MPLVAGVDSSTQSTKVLVVDSDTGEVVRRARRRIPTGTEVDPAPGRTRSPAACAERLARRRGGDLRRRPAARHGRSRLRRRASCGRRCSGTTPGRPLTPTTWWPSCGGPERWATLTGSVPRRELHRHQAALARPRRAAERRPRRDRRAAARLADAWVSPAAGAGHRPRRRVRHRLLVTRLGRLRPLAARARPRPVRRGAPAGARPGRGRRRDLLGRGRRRGHRATTPVRRSVSRLASGDVVISIGTSGVVSAVADKPTADASGLVAGFADATGRFLPLACTLNATQVLDDVRALLGRLLGRVRRPRAVRAGRCGRSGPAALLRRRAHPRPAHRDRPARRACGSASLTPATLARAAVEGVLCGLADGLDAIKDQSVPVERVLLVGGGARSRAMHGLAPTVFGVPVDVPEPAEYVALGAARQAAWVLSGADEPPTWGSRPARRIEAPRGSGGTSGLRRGPRRPDRRRFDDLPPMNGGLGRDAVRRRLGHRAVLRGGGRRVAAAVAHLCAGDDGCSRITTASR